MPQAEQGYTPASGAPSTTERPIATLAALRVSKVAARDALPAGCFGDPTIEEAYEQIWAEIAAADREILSRIPTTLAELGAHAAVVLDADFDFITRDARTVLAYVRDFAEARGGAS